MRLFATALAAGFFVAGAAIADDILLFGGDGHKEFLGCLTCSEYEKDSVANDFSRHGWGNGFGTWNPYGKFRNPYGSQSACNEYAKDPPVLVDRKGNYYGRLTISEARGDSVCGPRGEERVCRALIVMCATD